MVGNRLDPVTRNFETGDVFKLAFITTCLSGMAFGTLFGFSINAFEVLSWPEAV